MAGYLGGRENDDEILRQARAVHGTVRSHRVGEASVSWGAIPDEQLRTVLKLKESKPRRLGGSLFSLGFVSEENLARAVAEACGLEYVTLTEGMVDPAAVPLLGEKALRRYMALPLRVGDGWLVLTVADPTNVPNR